jgi:hypothetical protein
MTSVERIGWLSAIPYGIAALSMVLSSRNSDRLLERRWHGALAAFAGVFGLSLLPLLPLLALALRSARRADVGQTNGGPPGNRTLAR